MTFIRAFPIEGLASWEGVFYVEGVSEVDISEGWITFLTKEGDLEGLNLETLSCFTIGKLPDGN